MIQTMSSPNEWFQFYNQNFSIPPSISDSITATTTTTIPITTTTTTTAATMSTSRPQSLSTHLSPEGHVSKPRRRSRASRRTPTTLLNTDTTNFRAMVQQFTGGPSALPFTPTAASGFPNLMGLGFGSRPLIPPMNPTTTLMVSPSYNIQQQAQQQQHLYQNHNQQQFMFSGTTQGGDNTFFQRLSNSPRPPSNVVTDHDGVLMDDDEHGGGRFFPSTSTS